MKGGFIYIMTNAWLTLYVGVTSNLIKRTWEHKHEVVKGFTSKYKLHKLVYYEVFDTIEQAIIREKQIKDMNRKDKLEIITTMNPECEDLYNDLV